MKSVPNFRVSVLGCSPESGDKKAVTESGDRRNVFSTRDKLSFRLVPVLFGEISLADLGLAAKTRPVIIIWSRFDFRGFSP